MVLWLEEIEYSTDDHALALHVASSVGGAQFYMSCFQLNVGGSGSASPPTVKFPGAYSVSDPGILIDIYTSPKAYAIPGPTPYGTASPAVATTAYPTIATWNTAQQPATVPTTQPAGAPAPSSGSSSSTATVSSSHSSSSSSSSSSSASKTTPTTVAPTQTGTVAQYGQCGGSGYTGATVCASGFTCTALNAVSNCIVHGLVTLADIEVATVLLTVLVNIWSRYGCLSRVRVNYPNKTECLRY